MNAKEALEALRVDWERLRQDLDAGILDEDQICARTAYHERVLEQLESVLADASLIPLPTMAPGNVCTDSDCIMCGRPLRGASVTIELTTDGLVVPVGLDVGNRSQGAFRVGVACARKLPRAYWSR